MSSGSLHSHMHAHRDLRGSVRGRKYSVSGVSPSVTVSASGVFSAPYLVTCDGVAGALL